MSIVQATIDLRTRGLLTGFEEIDVAIVRNTLISPFVCSAPLRVGSCGRQGNEYESTSCKERKKETKVKNSKDSDDEYSHVPRLSSFVTSVEHCTGLARWGKGALSRGLHLICRELV